MSISNKDLFLEQEASLGTSQSLRVPLKRYVTMYKRWQLWLHEAKRVDPSGQAGRLGHLLVLRDEPRCLLKAVSWMEKVTEFKLELRATGGRLAGTAKNMSVEVLYKGAPLIQIASCCPVMVFVSIERVVLDDSKPSGQSLRTKAKKRNP